MPTAPYASLQQITGGQTLLVLAANPGDETRHCGGLIAQSCSRGRPPFVMVLADGSVSDPPGLPPDLLAAQREQETRAALRCLGLPPDRLLMARLFETTIPHSGPVFEAVVRAVILVMWARDCDVICAPAGPSPDHRATAAIAAEIARRSDVGLLSYATTDGLRLDITPQLPAKRAATAAYRSHPPQPDPAPFETLSPPR